jgi:ubiquinone/menaquinone biosynthesis C-methylase UbiE
MQSSSIATGTGDVRARIHGMWANVAPRWGERADELDARGAVVAERLLDATRPVPGERVLELACGPGGLGLAAARRVAPGEVVVSDVVRDMVEIAGARARALGLANVSCRVLDLERIDEPDESYDVVLCREGLMFAVDPGGAARELRRVLRPGGRAGIAVWGPRERNPWLASVFDVVSAELGRPLPPPGVPGPFSLADAAELGRLLGDAGLEDVDVSELPVPLEAPSFDAWWARTSTIAGPLVQHLAALPPERAQALQDRLREAIAPYATADGLRFPGVTLIATAVRR